MKKIEMIGFSRSYVSILNFKVNDNYVNAYILKSNKKFIGFELELDNNLSIEDLKKLKEYLTEKGYIE